MAFIWLWRIDFGRVLVQETSDRAVTTKKVTIFLTFSLTYQESTLSKWYYHMIICIKMTSNVNKLSKYASNLFPGPKNLKFWKFWFYFLRGWRPLYIGVCIFFCHSCMSLKDTPISYPYLQMRFIRNIRVTGFGLPSPLLTSKKNCSFTCQRANVLCLVKWASSFFPT